MRDSEYGIRGRRAATLRSLKCRADRQLLGTCIQPITLPQQYHASRQCGADKEALEPDSLARSTMLCWKCKMAARR